MKILSRLGMIAVVSVLATAATAQTQRSMDEMKGDCSAFAWNMAHEFEIWGRPGASITASASPASAPVVAVGAKLELLLAPHASVSFAAAPETDRGGPDKYSGVVKFTVPVDGVYRISASNGLWIDVVADGKPIPKVAFEMQTRCETIFKSVAYPLKAGSPLILQMNGSKSPTLGLSITPWPKD